MTPDDLTPVDYSSMPPLCEQPGCSRDLLPDAFHAGTIDGKWYCKRHFEALAAAEVADEPPVRHPFELDPSALAPMPPKPGPTKLVLITPEESEVIDLLNQVHDRFMSLTQTDPAERALFQSLWRQLVDRIMRRVAIRAFPGRFDS